MNSAYLFFIRTHLHTFWPQPLDYSKEEGKDQESIHTHYHNSNLIWRTVSRRVDEVIPLGSPETRSVEGDPSGMASSMRRDTVRQIKLLL